MRKIRKEDLPKFIIFIICSVLCFIGAIFVFIHALGS